MTAQRVLLEDIKALTFYSGEFTKGRRSSPIPQLTCIGKACKLYTPDAVQCVNVGGQGVDVNWKCEADLPEALRFGRVKVSCEGWERPGDPFVLKGSCGLEYRLVEVPNYRKYDNPTHKPKNGFFKNMNLADWLFVFVFVAIATWMLWGLLRPCFGHAWPREGGRTADSNRRGPSGGGGSGGGSRPSHSHPYHQPPTNPPPPYTKDPSSSSSQGGQERWAPGFWTGLGLGAGATYLAATRRSNQSNRQESNPQYYWEQSQFGIPATPQPSASARWSPSLGSGEGSSSGGGSLGPIRRATGVGGSESR